jgi:hypothetical protein
MKSLKEYLTESQKTYAFRIKVAGPLPEDFASKVKNKLDKWSCSKFEKSGGSPIQPSSIEFPNLTNVEVSVFEAECCYPVTPQEISAMIRETTGMTESCFKVRNANDPYEDQATDLNIEKSGKAFLNDPNYSEAPKVKVKDYFGDDFNKSFLRDLASESKKSKKDKGQGEYKLSKTKEDKAGSTSALSKVNNPNPVKG